MTDLRWMLLFFVCVTPVANCAAELVDFTSSGASFGSILDGAQTGDSGLSVPEIPGLFASIISVVGAGDGTTLANSGSDQFGVDSVGSGSGGDASTAFDSDLNESITLAFNQPILISSVRFAPVNASGAFDSGDQFTFGGTIIGFDDLDANFNFQFLSPLSLSVNEPLAFGATVGRVGFRSAEITAVPELSTLTLVGIAGVGGMFRRRRRRVA